MAHTNDCSSIRSAIPKSLQLTMQRLTLLAALQASYASFLTARGHVILCAGSLQKTRLVRPPGQKRITIASQLVLDRLAPAGGRCDFGTRYRPFGVQDLGHVRETHHDADQVSHGSQCIIC